MPLPLPKITDVALTRLPLLACLLFVLVAAPLPARAVLNNAENAIDLLGQFSTPTTDTTPNYTQISINNGDTGPNAIGFSNPLGLALDPIHHYLYVTDKNNHRVLVFSLNTDNSLSTASGGHTADYVLGQPNFTSNTPNGGQSGMQFPNSVAVDAPNNRLFVADYYNNRVLVFDTSTLSNGMNAANVLGQPNFATTTAGTTKSKCPRPAMWPWIP